MSQGLGYKQVTQAAAVTVKTGPAVFFGLTVVASTNGTVVVYDGTDNTGTVLFAKDSLAKGDVIHFGGKGYSAGKGLHVVCGNTATVNIQYT